MDEIKNKIAINIVSRFLENERQALEVYALHFTFLYFCICLFIRLRRFSYSPSFSLLTVTDQSSSSCKLRWVKYKMRWVLRFQPFLIKKKKQLPKSLLNVHTLITCNAAVKDGH